MFEVGKRYWAVNGDYRLKVLCVGRTRTRATFTMKASEAERYFGLKPKFTKALSEVDAFDDEGRQRECVPRMGRHEPAASWSITDQEVSTRRKETEHVGTGALGRELQGGVEPEPKGIRGLLRRAYRK